MNRSLLWGLLFVAPLSFSLSSCGGGGGSGPQEQPTPQPTTEPTSNAYTANLTISGAGNTQFNRVNHTLPATLVNEANRQRLTSIAFQQGGIAFGRPAGFTNTIHYFRLEVASRSDAGVGSDGFFVGQEISPATDGSTSLTGSYNTALAGLSPSTPTRRTWNLQSGTLIVTALSSTSLSFRLEDVVFAAGLNAQGSVTVNGTFTVSNFQTQNG